MISDLKKNFVEQLMLNVPTSLLSIKNEIEPWIHNFLTDWLAQHDLVTQAEFDLQCQRLNNMQEKFKALQDKITLLETQLKEATP
ncbi:accessory factor UbiK family protein [Candidatus Berkiella cookevillensis]|uniref:Accessory factor UbiK family protein n=1 Tax=Candidatus Berkiella cookevillensis TaxID=437022 RepID=A0A0Q9YE31_9GAMM|nr:accessory factor UbiK family protein [Candidatus Berkiella cookevillensis]MCS5709698.1 accessory factor UbiK family protein [Candidatus Berkiella cookevillensis]